MNMDVDSVDKYIQDMPDEVLSRLQFAMPWQFDVEDQTYVDPDGFRSVSPKNKEDPSLTRDVLQIECWEKFQRNPQINTSVRGLVGRLAGWGFETSSEIPEIQDAIEEIELDPRNRLYNFWPKYVGRANIEGELFLTLTCHPDGFIEVDFVDPANIGEIEEDGSGIIFHPDKTLMPIMYNIIGKNGANQQIPSVFVARYPELLRIAADNKDFKVKYQGKSKSRKKKFKQFGGFYRFIVAWDKSFITRRAISYLRTTIEWLNHYENLKKYEIDHKKSSGAYLWIFKITEPRAFKQWLALSDVDRRKTGIMSKKTPGASLILPPGIDVEVKNPNLTRIADEDTDIMQMVSSGLNEPSDITLGSSQSTFSSVTASRGPMSDRISDEIAYFERFLRYDFWGSIFFLKSRLNDFKEIYKVREAIGFDKEQEPVFGNRKKRPEQLLDFAWPISETVNYEGRAKGLLGVKHGPIADTVGVPNSEVAKRMGFGNYGAMRLKKATEDDRYPELIYTLDAEALQESAEAEPSKQKVIRDKKKEGKKGVTKKEE